MVVCYSTDESVIIYFANLFHKYRVYCFSCFTQMPSRCLHACRRRARPTSFVPFRTTTRTVMSSCAATEATTWARSSRCVDFCFCFLLLFFFCNGAILDVFVVPSVLPTSKGMFIPSQFFSIFVHFCCLICSLSLQADIGLALLAGHANANTTEDIVNSDTAAGAKGQKVGLIGDAGEFFSK